MKKRIDLLSPSQVTAALGLLKKVMPDLATVQLEGNPDAPIVTEIRRTIVDPAIDAKPVEAHTYLNDPKADEPEHPSLEERPVIRRIVN